MSYAAALPAPALQKYIARYWTLRGRFERGESITLLPDCGVHVVLTLGEPVRSEHYGNPMACGEAQLVGAMLHSDRQLLFGEPHLVGVTFRPGAFVCFHKWDPLTCAANRVQGFDRAFPADAARRFTDIAELARYLDRFYLERFTLPSSSLGEVIADIEACGGQVRIDELLRRHAMTGRTLERRFAEQVGTAPKEFINVTRFSHALSKLERSRGLRTLEGLARDCGYYDAAHLSNAFKRFTGQPPSRFTLSDLSKSASAVADNV